jgi:tight adherence protein C
MDLLPLVAALLIFATVFFLVLSIASGSAGGANTVARARLDALTRGASEQDAQGQRAGVGSRLIGPMFGSITQGLGRLLPKSLLSGVERKLIIAGEPMTMNGFLTMIVVASTAATGFGFVLIFAIGSGIGLMQIGIMAALGMIGFYMPFNIVTSRARQRQNAIIKSLPDAFDLITTCVEAGLGLDAALARVSEKVEGPFAQELSRSLRDIALGKQRKDALKELGERTQVPDLMQFTNAVIQAESMGSSVGTVLRVQSDQLRVRRRQRAEEQAYKAPVKMLFPLVLCIFPTLFIVILGPAIITIMQGFPK